MVLETPSQQILQATNELGAISKVLAPDESETIRQFILNKFTKPEFVKWENYKWAWIWENLQDGYSSVFDPKAWSDLDNFLSGRSFLMFFNYNEDNTVIEFLYGTTLTPILAKAQSSEFYLSDRESSFMLCYNHEQFLIAVGSAANWLENFYR